MTDTTHPRPHHAFAWRLRSAGPRGRHGGPPLRPRGHGHGRHFPFGGPGDDFGGGGRRAGRGDVRAAILALLHEAPMHGYQIMQELESRSGGAWRVSPGSIYPTLQQLQDEALISSTEEPGGRRVFALTDAARDQAKASAAAPPWQVPGDSRTDEASSTRKLFGEVAAAAWQVGKTGSPEQVTEAQEILRDTRRRLYRLLADDPTTSR